MKRHPLYGLMAEFENDGRPAERRPAQLREGYRQMDAFTPFPVEGLAEAIGFHKTRVPADLFDRRIDRMLRRVLSAMVAQRDRLSAEHRRQAVQQLAVISSPSPLS